jgi:hypothetical protein
MPHWFDLRGSIERTDPHHGPRKHFLGGEAGFGLINELANYYNAAIKV